MEEIVYKHLPMVYANINYKTIMLREAFKIMPVLETIGSGKLDGYEYKITNKNGLYPTAYIKIKESQFLNKNDLEEYIEVHGGITYSEKEDDGYWIGWDYVHTGDYFALFPNKKNKKWTTDEILEHCKDVVKQLKGYKPDIEILNVEWFSDIGIVTIDNGFEVKTYMKQVRGLDEKEDIKSIISLGYKVYPSQLEKILSFYKKDKPADKSKEN